MVEVVIFIDFAQDNKPKVFSRSLSDCYLGTLKENDLFEDLLVELFVSLVVADLLVALLAGVLAVLAAAGL